MQKYTLIILLSILTNVFSQDFYINEILATNTSACYDEHGDFEDFIEIYIPTNSSINLNDYYLTDYLNDPTKWSFPNITITDTTWLIIWADDDIEQGEMHAGFKLNGTLGEGVYLFDNSLTLVDSITFGIQIENISLGRSSDGDSSWNIFDNPTPGFNNQGIADFIADATVGEFEFTVNFSDITPLPPAPSGWEDLELSISNWDWQFSDGQNSSDQNPLITFPDIGIYDVSLSITFNNGSSDIVIFENYISVIERLGKATFLWNSSTYDSEAYYGLWTYDYNTDSWQYLGWPPNLSAYYAQFANGGIVYDAESDRILMLNTYNNDDYSGFWAYDYNTNSWDYLGRPTNLSSYYIQHFEGSIVYDAESDKILMWNSNYDSNGIHFGFWAYDFNSDTWDHLGWPDQINNNHYYGDFNNGTITYDAESDRVLLWNTETQNNESYFGLWSYDYNANTWEYLGMPNQLNGGYYYADFADGTITYDIENDKVVLWNSETYNANMYFGVWSYDYNTDTWEYLGWEDNSDWWADFNNGTITYDIDYDKTLVWNNETSNDGYYMGFWSYDYNANTWEYLGWPDEHIPYSSYASFGNETIIYGGYYFIGPDWFVSSYGNDNYSVTRGSENDPFLTIQHAITKAFPGHTIWIDDGTWSESLNLHGKHLTIRSINTGAVILDGSGLNDAVLTVSSTLDTTYFIDLIIQDASVPSDSLKGGAVDARNSSSLVFENVTIKRCYSGYNGGGLYASGSYVEFQSCIIDSNYALENGGGFYADSSSTFKIINTTLLRNDASQGAAGYIADSSTIELFNSNIINNHSSLNGGGLSVNNSSLTAENSAISNNISGSGSAFYLNSISNMTINNTTITENESISGGGAIIVNNGSNITITNSLMDENFGNYGGALCLFLNSSGMITSSDFTNNSALTNAGALKIETASEITINNTNFYGNYVPDTSYGGAISVESGGIVNLENTKIDSNSAGIGSAFTVNNAAINLTSSKVIRNSSENSTVSIESNASTMVYQSIFFDNNQKIKINDASNFTLDWTIIHQSWDDSSLTFELSDNSTLTVTSSMVQGTQSGIIIDETSTLDWEEEHLPWYGGNLPEVNPLFCNAPNDLNICEDSQCIIFNPNDPGDIDGYPIGGISVGCEECGQHGPENLVISDRANDQGGYIEARFDASYYDTAVPEENRETEFYQLWMRLPNTEDWIAINTAGALGYDEYLILGSTPMDSTSLDSAIFEFKVSAHMEEGNFLSDISIGYSIDNTAPFAPENIIVNNQAGNLLLSWNMLGNSDLYYWEIYKNGEYMFQVYENYFQDNLLDFGGIVNYTIRGIDIHENLGAFSEPFIITNGILGDATWDNNINVLDVIRVVYMILNDDEEYTEGEVWSADINADGEINIIDVLLIVQIAMGDDFQQLLINNTDKVLKEIH